jgi:hypothetical protein
MRCPRAQCNERVTEEEIEKSAPELLSYFQEQQFAAFLISIGNGVGNGTGNGTGNDIGNGVGNGVGNDIYARSCPGTECNFVAVSSRDHHFGNIDRAVSVTWMFHEILFSLRKGAS